MTTVPQSGQQSGPARSGHPRPVTGDPSIARTILDAPDVSRALTRIAHEILDRTKGGTGVVLLGIPTRGVTLARRIGRRISEVEGVEGPVGSLDVPPFREDLAMGGG